MAKYSLGLDFGTNSVRALIVDVVNGAEVATRVHDYESGEAGILLSNDPNLARQHPADYLSGTETAVKGAIGQASGEVPGFDPGHIIGIGVDTTGSTPIPVDVAGKPLAFADEFADDLAAMAWLWKDHTSHAEAAEISELAARIRPQYLARCGGTYSSEWFFSKILHCLRTSPAVFEGAHTWVEIADWIPAVLCGTDKPEDIVRCVCAAGHKAMYHPEWGGLPDAEFLSQLDPRLGELRGRLFDEAFAVDELAGRLCSDWAKRLGLAEGTPVAVGAFDAHLGAVASGVGPGRFVQIIGTSSCDMMVAPLERELPDIPGLCGIVPGSILPGFYGLEAGQSAVGDIYNWFVNYIQPGGAEGGSHEELTTEAEKLAPGESGLLALDWNNGNRTILVDQLLTGLIVGQTLHTRPAEIYRALIEATAFGALTIINRFEEYGVKVEDVVNCGGIAEKNPLVLQIYADVTGRPMKVARSSQTCALGAAICGAVAAGAAGGGYDDFASAQAAMAGLKEIVYDPDPAANAVYGELFELYSTMHDAFGTTDETGDLSAIMKRLIEIRSRVRAAREE